jgi:hypothetical protein
MRSKTLGTAVTARRQPRSVLQLQPMRMLSVSFGFCIEPDIHAPGLRSVAAVAAYSMAIAATVSSVLTIALA